MKAIMKEGASVAVREVPRPRLTADDEVIIRVAMAGLCRTDLYVAEGRIGCKDPLILGHEFSGVIHTVGAAVRGLAPGDRVTAMPVIPCFTCETCLGGAETACERSAMLGIHRDGAFAEFIAVPARSVYRVPETMPFKAAAYSEPVAAALAVLNAGIQPQESGLIYGYNRFSLLIQDVLKAHGFTRVVLHDPRPDAERLPPCAYDFIIETLATTETLAEMIRAARPFAKIILRSRQPKPPGIDLLTAVRKELTFRAVNYGSFKKGIAMMAEGRINLAELLGPAHRLEDFQRVFTEARRNESSKFFFSLSDGQAD